MSGEARIVIHDARGRRLPPWRRVTIVALILCAIGCGPRNAPKASANQPEPSSAPAAVQTALTYEDLSAAIHEVADKPAPPAGPPKKPGPWVIQEAVLFVYIDRSIAGEMPNRMPDATAFVLKVNSRTNPNGPGKDPPFLRFLVTARHVIQPSWMGCPGATAEKDPAKIIVRFNKIGGGVSSDELTLYEGGKPLFIASERNDVDLAALMLTQKTLPNIKAYTFIDLPFKNLATDQEMEQISTGAAVMTAGLLPNFAGTQQNYPIFKSGTFSNKLLEPVPVTCPDLLTQHNSLVWLIDAMLPPGTSGAPVFWIADRGPGNNRIPVLIGIQSFSWLSEGVAGITPSGELVDLMTRALARFDVDLIRGIHATP